MKKRFFEVAHKERSHEYPRLTQPLRWPPAAVRATGADTCVAPSEGWWAVVVGTEFVQRGDQGADLGRLDLGVDTMA